MQQCAQGDKRPPEQPEPTSHPSKRQKCDEPSALTSAANDQIKAENTDAKVGSVLRGAASSSDSQPEVILSDITKTPSYAAPTQISHTTKGTCTDGSTSQGTSAHVDTVQAEATRLEYGLFCVQSLFGNEEIWLGCKFCPKFGCQTRKKGYFMMFCSPFNTAYIIKHLRKEHPKEWQQYSNLDKGGKEAFFGHVALPGRRKIVKRAKELLQGWSGGTRSHRIGQQKERGSASARVGEGDAEGGEQKKSIAGGEAKEEEVMRGGEAGVCERTAGHRRVSGSRLVSSDEHYAGRRLSQQDGVAEEGGGDETVNQVDGELGSQMTIHSLDSCFGRLSEVSSDLRQTVLSGVLSDKCVRPHSQESASFLALHRHELGQMMPADKSSLDEKLKHLRGLYVFVLYHLLRGVSVDVIGNLAAQVELLYTVGEGEVISANTENINAKVAQGPTRQCVTPVRNMENSANDGVEGIVQTTHNCDENNSNIDGKELTESMPLKEKLVWDCGNSVCAEALQMLREALRPSDLNWALLLTTRRCEESGHGAVEFLIQVRAEGSVVDWIHLVSVLDTQDAGKAVVEVLNSVVPDWPHRLMGLKSGLRTVDVSEKNLEESVVHEIRKKEEVQDGFHYVGKDGVHPFVDYRSATGPELAVWIHANKRRYCESTANQQEVKERLDMLQAEEICLQNHKDKVFDVRMEQDEEMVPGKFPCTLELVTYLNELWAYPLPISGDMKARLRIGWFDRLMTAGGTRSYVVNPLLERVLLAREFVRLHSLLCTETSVGKYLTKGACERQAKRLKILKGWGWNWYNMNWSTGVNGFLDSSACLSLANASC